MATTGRGAGAIQAINSASIHRICSGQVILDLATAVKELIENSLDAGGSNIEVRLREYGSTLIEVADNGCGVRPEDYAGLTAKYHTSKIRDFRDLTGVATFGFRGEALSSLCAVSDLSVVTRCADQETGTRLEFDSHGRLVSSAPCPRAVGTTIAVKDLFKSLPVRHKEFLRHLKREFAKLVGLLQAYALIATQARIIVTNQATAGAGRTTVLSTPGPSAGRAVSVRDNIVAVFGAKAADTLQPFEADLKDLGVKITGYVSRANAGIKGDTSRQFLYINGRPVDLPKAVKVLNDTYRSLSSALNNSAKPMAVLNLELARDEYDVNVTPDKRKVFVQAEAQIMTALEQELQRLWEPSRYTFASNSLRDAQAAAGRPRAGALAAFAHGQQRAQAKPQPIRNDDDDEDELQPNEEMEDAEASEPEAQQPWKRRRLTAADQRQNPAFLSATEASMPATASTTVAMAVAPASPTAATALATSAAAGVAAADTDACGASTATAVLPALAVPATAAAGTAATSAAAASTAQLPAPTTGTDTVAGRATAATAPASVTGLPPARRHPFLGRIFFKQPTLPSAQASRVPLPPAGPPAAPAAGPVSGRPHANADVQRHALPGHVHPEAHMQEDHQTDLQGGKYSQPAEQAQGIPAEHPLTSSPAGELQRNGGPELMDLATDVTAEQSSHLQQDSVFNVIDLAVDGHADNPSRGQELVASQAQLQPSPGDAADQSSPPTATDQPPVTMLWQAPSGELLQHATGLELQGMCSLPESVQLSKALLPQQAELQVDEEAQQGACMLFGFAQVPEQLEVQQAELDADQQHPHQGLDNVNATHELQLHAAPVSAHEQDMQAQHAPPAAHDRLHATLLSDSQPHASPHEMHAGWGADADAPQQGSVMMPPGAPPQLQQGDVYDLTAELPPTESAPASEPLPVAPFDLAWVQRCTAERIRRAAAGSGRPVDGAGRRFARASLQAAESQEGESRADQEAAAERELERAFNKSDFRSLQVLGQFNLGFILAQLNGDVFIIDQHAADEKYNFERLQREVVLNKQPLLIPRQLDLPPLDEMVIRDHMDVFQRNGFDFSESADTGEGSRLRLSAVPFSKGTQFGLEDVEELVGRIKAGEDTESLRPSRVRAMLASRACRSSIMIGRALDRNEMRRVLDHMADMEQPWNCPHGRPTMRHVCTLPMSKAD